MNETCVLSFPVNQINLVFSLLLDPIFLYYMIQMDIAFFFYYIIHMRIVFFLYYMNQMDIVFFVYLIIQIDIVFFLTTWLK